MTTSRSKQLPAHCYEAFFKEIPILFSGLMVRAILDDRKTHTRRVIKSLDKCPYGEPGDRLWVREAFRVTGWTGTSSRIGICGHYHADGATFSKTLTATESAKFILWKRKLGNRGSIYCFRSLSRITLEVVTVRVEQLNNISAGDAIREQWGTFTALSNDWTARGRSQTRYLGNPEAMAVEDFRELWDSINSKRGFGWDQNPLVWVIGFKKS